MRGGDQRPFVTRRSNRLKPPGRLAADRLLDRRRFHLPLWSRLGLAAGACRNGLCRKLRRPRRTRMRRLRPHSTCYLIVIFVYMLKLQSISASRVRRQRSHYQGSPTNQFETLRGESPPLITLHTVVLALNCCALTASSTPTTTLNGTTDPPAGTT